MRDWLPPFETLLPASVDLFQALLQLAIGFALAWGISRLARRIAHRRRLGIGPEYLDCLAQRVAPAPEEHAKDVGNHPHDATRARCSASLR